MIDGVGSTTRSIVGSGTSWFLFGFSLVLVFLNQALKTLKIISNLLDIQVGLDSKFPNQQLRILVPWSLDTNSRPNL